LPGQGLQPFLFALTKQITGIYKSPSKGIEMKFCAKCNCDTDRYATGRCKRCLTENTKAWRLANTEQVKATKKTYYLANSEFLKASFKAWRLANNERSNAYSAAFAKANPQQTRINNQNYKARALKNGGVLSKGLIAKLFALQDGKCACCDQPLGSNYHLDHIMPIALGGPNTDDNIQLLLARCNLQKGSKHPVEFIKQRNADVSQ
jgi:5-methylcytosine-specific restriction endonuclease McrA